jgi:WhiB family transcriptional regulator, redox-sensing transcriptional regulator
MIDRDLRWMEQGACRGMDGAIFFPERGDVKGHGAIAKRVCAICPVRQRCLDFALARHERHGIWGGADAQERRQITRRRRVEAA